MTLEKNMDGRWEQVFIFSNPTERSFLLEAAAT